MSVDVDYSSLTTLRTFHHKTVGFRLTDAFPLMLGVWFNEVNDKGEKFFTINVAAKISCGDCVDYDLLSDCSCNPVFGLESRDSRLAPDPDLLCELSLAEEGTDMAFEMSVDDPHRVSFLDYLSEYGVNPYEGIVLESTLVSAVHDVVFGMFRGWLENGAVNV